MKKTTFYQLLNRELPRAINGASRLLGSVKDETGSFITGRRGGSTQAYSEYASGLRDPALMDVYPALNEKPLSLLRGNERHSLLAVRDMVGQLSLAYAISNYDRFAEMADGWLIDDLLASEILASQEWEEDFSLIKDEGGVKSHIAMIEVVLSFELLRARNVIEVQHLRDLRRQLGGRLENLTRKSVERLALKHQFAWLLERVTIALFLNDQDAIEKVGYSVRSKYQNLFLSFLNGVESVDGEDLIQAFDCYFALCFWLDRAQVQGGGFVSTAFDQLCDRFDNPGLINIPRGIWVSPDHYTLLDVILRQSSVLLFVGEGLGRTDLIDCWFESEKKSPAQASEFCGLLTRPLLWFNSDDWHYRPFILGDRSCNTLGNRN